MFNLRQLMQLQDERLAEEERELRARRAAERAAQERATQRELDAAAERAQLAALAKQRAELERETALLRVQLEAAAAERSRDATRQPTPEAPAPVQAATPRTLRGAVLAALAVAALACCGRLWLDLSDAQRGLSRAAAQASSQAREVNALQERLDSALAAASAAPPTAPPIHEPQSEVKLTRHQTHRHPPHIEHKETTLEIDDQSDDPLKGL